MKAALILLIAFVGCSTAALWKSDVFSHTNGQPGCRTNIEFGVKWANTYDNLRYWICTSTGAVSYICPTEYLFDYDRQACIRWNFWEWRQPFDPPTMATA